jgi:L-ascorbate metabolism protein UlaG (beta-lactamase superfamily)
LKKRNLVFTGFLAALAASLVACSTITNYPESDHYREDRFSNPAPIEPPGFFRVAWHILFGRNGQWPDKVTSVPSSYVHPQQEDGEIAVTFVGHASVLIQIQGINVLTDPVWSERVGVWGWAGPKRVRPPGIPIDRLPPIHAIVISHNHYDHLDLPTLRTLSSRDNPVIYVPLGNAAWMQSEGIANVREMDWWDTAYPTAGLEIIFTPAQHNSGRGLFDTNKTLWGSFFIRTKCGSVYFAGDTAYFNQFSRIRERLGPPDIALLPIGAYEPEKMMRRFHMNPAEAIQAQRDLQASFAVGIHYDMFQTTGEDFGEAPRELKRTLEISGKGLSSFSVLAEGQTEFYSAKKIPCPVSTK